MVTSDTVDALFASVRQLITGAVISVSPEGRRWLIEMPDGPPVFASLDPPREALVITAPLGVPPAQSSGTLAVFLLQLNFAWLDSGGLRLALDSAPGESQVHLIWEVPLSGLGPHEAHAALTNFSVKARSLTTLIAQGGPSQDDGPDLSSPGDVDHMIRV